MNASIMRYECLADDCPGHDEKPLFSVEYSQALLVKKGNRVKDCLVAAVEEEFDRHNEIHGLALNLCGYTEASTGLIKRLKDDIKLLKQENADIRLGSRRFTCFGRLPTEIRAMIWELAAVETHTPKIFQVDIARMTRHDGGPEYSVRYARQNVAQACKESRYLLHPLKPEENDWEMMSEKRREVLEKGLTWGWNDISGWAWFQGARDGILLSGSMLDSEKATGEKALGALEALVGPLRRVLLPWRENPNGDDLGLGTGMFAKFGCLRHLQSLEFVMLRRRIKRSDRAHWPILPFAVDVDDPVAVKDALNGLGDDAAFFRRDARYFGEPDYIIEDAGPAEYWGIFHKCIQEDWLLAQDELDPYDGDDKPVVDREVVDWGHPWVREHLKKIPLFKRVILLE
ncbi:hypothetical protein PG990_009898 [Apiospora arundinis]